jgi:hypothetical protein
MDRPSLFFEIDQLLGVLCPSCYQPIILVEGSFKYSRIPYAHPLALER